MINLGPLLTPYVPIQQAPVGFLGHQIANMGQALEHQREFDAQQAMQQERMAQEAELQRAQLAETARYHDLGAQERADRLGEQQQVKDEQRANVLFDMLGKAQRTGNQSDIQTVLDQLKRHGYDVKEGETSLPEETPQPQAGTQAAGASPYKPASPFQKQLAGFMAAQPQTPEQAPSAPPGSLPPEIAAIAPMQARPKPPEAPAAPKRGGRYQIFKNGELVHEYDAPVEQAKMRQQIIAMGSPVIEQAGTPEEKQDAKVAADHAAALVGIMPTDKVVDAYQRMFKELSDRRKKQGPAGGGGSLGAPTKADMKEQSHLDDVQLKVYSAMTGREDYKDVLNAKRGADSALTMLAEGDEKGMLQHGALKQYLFSISGKVVTDGEMERLLNSTGKFNNWEAAVNTYTSGGVMPEGFKSQLHDLLTIVSTRAGGQIKELGDAAFQTTLNMTGDESRADTVRGMVTHEFKAPAQPRLGQKKPSGPAAPTTPAATGGETIEQKRERLRKLVGD